LYDVSDRPGSPLRGTNRSRRGDGVARRWVIGIVVVCLIVGLIAFARGRAHHRGDDVGSGALGRIGEATQLAPTFRQEGVWR